MSDQNELYYAHMEADRNEAEKAYFEARPSLGAEVDRALFRAGFERAYAKLWPLWIIQLNEQQRASQETSTAPSSDLDYDEASGGVRVKLEAIQRRVREAICDGEETRPDHEA